MAGDKITTEDDDILVTESGYQVATEDYEAEVVTSQSGLIVGMSVSI